MTITEEQAAQAKEIILETLDIYHGGSLPYRQVWTRPAEDFDGVPFLDVWIIYAGDPSVLNIRMLNSYDSYLWKKLRAAGIYALPATSYVPESELEELGEPWLDEPWLGKSWTG